MPEFDMPKVTQQFFIHFMSLFLSLTSPLMLSLWLKNPFNFRFPHISDLKINMLSIRPIHIGPFLLCEIAITDSLIPKIEFRRNSAASSSIHIYALWVAFKYFISPTFVVLN